MGAVTAEIIVDDNDLGMGVDWEDRADDWEKERGDGWEEDWAGGGDEDDGWWGSFEGWGRGGDEGVAGGGCSSVICNMENSITSLNILKYSLEQTK